MIEIIKCELDKDFQGVTIVRKQYTEVSGVKYYSELQRKAFRKYTVNENDETVLNNNFETEIDAWTGIDNFIGTKFNF